MTQLRDREIQYDECAGQGTSGSRFPEVADLNVFLSGQIPTLDWVTKMVAKKKSPLRLGISV